MCEPNPKHTASWLSRVTFAFLDPIIWKAYRQKTHLRHDQLPPLADSWEAKYHARRAAKVRIRPVSRLAISYRVLEVILTHICIMRSFWTLCAQGGGQLRGACFDISVGLRLVL